MSLGSHHHRAKLRRLYREWSKQGRSCEDFKALFDEMAEHLPAHRCSIQRLKPERGVERLRADHYRSCLRDVDLGKWKEWKPLICEGQRFASDLLVVDGNHRAHALLSRNVTGGIPCVILKPT